MTNTRKLDKIALLLLRKKVRDAFPAPAWGDHVLNGVQMFTTAKRVKGGVV